MSDEEAFHLFPNLPPELRDKIWRLCFPRRVHEMNVSSPEKVYGAKIPCAHTRTTKMNSAPPLIYHVCRDARAITLETGGFGCGRYTSPRPPEITW